MVDISTKHFDIREFSCKCGCGVTKPCSELFAVLELVRVHFNKPVTINSSYRCEKHNAEVGGAKNSKHKLGIAADIVVKGVEPKLVYQFIDATFPNSYGLGSYNSFTHIDVRPIKARW